MLGWQNISRRLKKNQEDFNHTTKSIFTRLKKHYRCTYYIIYPLTKAPRWWKNLSAHLLPRVRRSSQQTKQHYNDGYTPTSRPLTEMKKRPDNPTCPILWEHHQTSPQIDHLHNHWIQLFPLPTDSNLKQQKLFSFHLSLWHTVESMM